VRVCDPINRPVTVEEASRIVIEKQTFFLPTEVCCCSSFPVLLPSSSPDSGWVGGLSRLLTINLLADSQLAKNFIYIYILMNLVVL
jgi:hypothetical protein